MRISMHLGFRVGILDFHVNLLNMTFYTRIVQRYGSMRTYLNSAFKIGTKPYSIREYIRGRTTKLQPHLSTPLVISSVKCLVLICCFAKRYD